MDLSHFKAGRVYAVPVSLATLMIVEGWATPDFGSESPTLRPMTFDLHRTRERRRRLLTDARLRTELGIAADRRRHH
jgi:hypothetical protein